MYQYQRSQCKLKNEQECEYHMSYIFEEGKRFLQREIGRGAAI